MQLFSLQAPTSSDAVEARVPLLLQLFPPRNKTELFSCDNFGLGEGDAETPKTRHCHKIHERIDVK